MSIWKIHERLYVGSVPEAGDQLARLKIHVLGLCAEELQLPAAAFPGVRVVYCPLDDSLDPITPTTWHLMNATTGKLADLHRKGRRILVTCHMGINRSALISALALREITGHSGRVCLEHVRHARPGALRNPRFAEELARLPRPSAEIGAIQR